MDSYPTTPRKAPILRRKSPPNTTTTSKEEKIKKRERHSNVSLKVKGSCYHLYKYYWRIISLYKCEIKRESREWGACSQWPAVDCGSSPSAGVLESAAVLLSITL